MAVKINPLPEEICKNCKFFSEATSECRRYAPKAFLSESGKLITFYPKTTEKDTCGEYSLSADFFKTTINNEEKK